MDTTLSIEALSTNSIVKASAVAFLILTVYLLTASHGAGHVHFPPFPVWILVEGHIISQLIIAGGLSKKLSETFRRHSGSLFGLSSIHRVIYGTQMAKDVLRKPHHMVHNEPAQWDLMVKVFGTHPSKRAILQASVEDLSNAISKTMMQEATLRPIMESTYMKTRDLTPFLVSLTPNSPLQPWEFAASPSIILSPSSNKPPTVEVDFFPLIRDFAANISISLLFGSDLLIQYPTIISDLWTLDAAFGPLALGIPSWAPFPLIRDAISAQKRLKGGVSALHTRLDAEADGIAEPELTERLRDSSALIRARNAAMRKHGVDSDTRGAFDLALLWAMNANTNNFVFWLLAYIYSVPDLLPLIRAEIAPYIKLSKSEGKIEALDTEGVLNKSPLLKSCYFESFRLAHEPMSLRYVEKGFDVTDSSNRTPATRIPSGTFLTVPHTIQQRDPANFPDPEKFKPDRFLETIVDEESGKQRQVARYGPYLKPWGEGAGMCRGRIFAEREVLAMVACVVSVWDVKPGDEDGGKWKLPGRKTGTGVCLPDRAMKVRVSRRDILD